MEVRAIYRGARISAFKVREVTREIQGLQASAALDIVAFSPKKAATLIGKTLRSAIANAENNADLRVERLVVKEATVGEGSSMKRFKSRARGSASTIVKRSSHIRIVLSDDLEPTNRTPKATRLVRKLGDVPNPSVATVSANQPGIAPSVTNEVADAQK